MFLFIFGFVCSSFGQDTLNQLDGKQQKQGLWIFLGITEKKTGFADTDTISIVNYRDNKRSGICIDFNPENIRKSIVEYQNGRPFGKYILYDKVGCILETGTFQKNTYLDTMIQRSECDGEFQIKVYKSTAGFYGRLTGDSFYYHPDGKLKMYVNYINGNENYWTKYDTSGKESFRSPTFHDSLRPPANKMKVDPNDYFDDRYMKQQLKPIDGSYNGPVYKDAVKPRNKQISEDGEFKDGKLWNGKKYVYDKNGLLDRIEIYKEGKYVGDGELD